MTMVTASLGIFYFTVSCHLLLEICDGRRSADLIEMHAVNGLYDMGGTNHAFRGEGRRGCSRDRIPGTRVANVRDRSVAGVDPNVRT